MKYDVIVVGAGIGGLSSAARLASAGKKVLVLEMDRHIGGTSYIFRRGGYGFPMGPLAFAFPERVRRFLEAIDPENPVEFRRSHFAVAGAGGDVIISRPLHELEPELELLFPADREGLGRFFGELEEAVSLSRDVDRWHPDFRFGRREGQGPKAAGKQSAKVARARELAVTPCADRLRRHLKDERLVRLLGSQGTAEPEMSMLKLGFMWSVMSEAGIWSPSCGIHGLSDRLAAAVLRGGGEIGLSRPVAGIIVERGRAVGVVTADGVRQEADWVISNADAKTTFLKLLEAACLPEDFRRGIDAAPYTGSALRVYLGIDPRRVDLSGLPTCRSATSTTGSTRFSCLSERGRKGGCTCRAPN